MYDTVDEITEAISVQEANLTALRTRMEDDFDLWALTPYEAEDATGKKRKGYQSYTSSAPRNFFEKVLNGLNEAALTIQIRLPEGASEAERRAANKGELYLLGALDALDRRLNKRGEPPLREGLGHFICLRGWYALRALVYLPKEGKETVFDVLPWDPLHVVSEIGSSGLLWAAYKRRATKGQILAEYGVVIKGQDAEVIDFWDAERNSVIVEGVFGKAPTEHRIGHPPILLGAVGSMPSMQRSALSGSSATASVLEERGESVWASSRALYKPWNRHVSTLMDVHERAMVGSLIVKSRDGQKSLEGDPYQNWQQILLAEGEDVQPLTLPKAPPETAAILGLIGQDLQQSTLPYPLAYGGTQQGLSGRALAILTEATRSVYNPRTEALARVYTWLCEELLLQFARKGIKGVELKGFKGDKGKEFFEVAMRPSEVKPSWSIKVEVEPRMPRDEEAEIMMSLAATQKRGPEDIPLMSKQTARENILKFPNPDAEKDKVLEEMGEALAPIMAANVAAALKRRGKDELAEQVMMLLRPSGAQAPPPQLSPQLVEAIIKALVTSGQPQLAEALLRELGGKAPVARAAPGPAPAPGAAPGPGPGPMPGPALGPAPAAMPPGEIGGII